MSDDRDLRKHTRRGALALMGLGAGLAATETLGFTDVTRDRGLNIGVSTDDNAVLTITGVPKGGSGTENTLNNFDANSPATPPLDISFTNETNVATATNGFELQITGGTIQDSSDFTKNNGTFTTKLSANGENEDSATVTVDNNTGEKKSITVEVVNVNFNNGTSISLTRDNVVIGSPVTDLTTSTPDTDDTSVMSGDSIDIEVSAEDNQDDDDITNIEISGTVSSTTDVEVTSFSDSIKTGDSSSSVIFSPEFHYTGESDSGDAVLEFSADGVSESVTVTVDAN